jgi:metal-responsive CopG/Arc/MetJ family transcriptional regulator
MVVVPVRLPASLLLELDEWVALARRSRSEAIRLWIENGLLQKPRRGWYKPKSDIL